jgi:hypothetical protein
MQGITAYLPVGFCYIFYYISALWVAFNHMFIWLDPEVVAHDKLIAGKSGYFPFCC